MKVKQDFSRTDLGAFVYQVSLDGVVLGFAYRKGTLDHSWYYQTVNGGYGQVHNRKQAIRSIEEIMTRGGKVES